MAKNESFKKYVRGAKPRPGKVKKGESKEQLFWDAKKRGTYKKKL